ncbi:PmoA family protein [Streptomonospora sediminis]
MTAEHAEYPRPAAGTATAARQAPAPGAEPPARGLGLVHEHGRCLQVTYGGAHLVRYVHHPADDQLESPRPYFHPIRTLGGDTVSLYRPHDHVWHKGIAWSLPHVGPANFWGGPTYIRDRGYRQLANDGAMQHRGFDLVSAAGGEVAVSERLEWVTEQGETWFTERRGFRISADPARSAWTLVFETEFTNLTASAIAIGSPTTAGRDNAGYGGLFWRGPRSFSGGRVYTPDREGGDDMMGLRAPWLAFAGRHDDRGGASTLVFADAPDNPGHPVAWFVRSSTFAAVCPAPFFSEEVEAAPGTPLAYRYAVVIADGDRGRSGSAELAETGLAELGRPRIGTAAAAPGAPARTSAGGPRQAAAP